LLKERLASFEGNAREILDWLDPRISDAEIEAMSSPTANLLGTLECLLVDDLRPALRKLLELDSILRMPNPLAASVTTRSRRQVVASPRDRQLESSPLHLEIR
jgi:hypothetical protein